MNKNVRPTRDGGFTLIEVAIATIIIGLAMTAMLISIAAGTRTSKASQQLTEAGFLAQEMREWTITVPFDELSDTVGGIHYPPRDGMGQTINDMPSWAQIVLVTWRNPNDILQTIADGTSDLVEINAYIIYDGKIVLNTRWLATRRN